MAESQKKSKGGRKPKYDYKSEEFLSLVESYAKKGFTDKEIACAEERASMRNLQIIIVKREASVKHFPFHSPYLLTFPQQIRAHGKKPVFRHRFCRVGR